MKKIGRLAAVFGLTMLLSGCTVTGLDAQTLMAPPSANTDQQEIQKLLLGDKPDVTYVYPRGGDYRSAVIMHDFDGDGVEDAIGFMLMEDGVEVRFLSKNEAGAWRTAAAFKNPATQVDRVCFGDLNGDGSDEIMIGWGNTQNNMSAALCVYTVSEGFVSEIHAENPYGGLVLTDFDHDGTMEIFVIRRPVPAADESEQSEPARAELLTLQGDELVSGLSVEADNSIVKYSSLVFGKISRDQYAVVLDGAKADSSMTTQIFYIGDSGRLLNIPPGVNTEGVANPLYRPAGAGGIARDIDGDGIIEFPVVSMLPAIADPAAVDSTSFLVDWSKFDSEKMEYRSTKKTLVNYAEGYWFTLPQSLAGKITAINDSKLKAVTYYSVSEKAGENQEPLMGSPLFTIRVFTRAAWQQRGQTSGYEKLDEKDDYVYGIAVSATDEMIGPSIGTIKRSFQTDG